MEIKSDPVTVPQREMDVGEKSRRPVAEKSVTQQVDRELRPEVKISKSFGREIRALRQSHQQTRRDLRQVEKAQKLFDRIEPLLIRIREISIEGGGPAPDMLGSVERAELDAMFDKIRANMIRISERIDLPRMEILELGLVIPEPPGPSMSALPTPTLPPDPIQFIRDNLAFEQNGIHTLTASRMTLARSDSALHSVFRLIDVLDVAQSRLEDKIRERSFVSSFRLRRSNKRSRSLVFSSSKWMDRGPSRRYFPWKSGSSLAAIAR